VTKASIPSGEDASSSEELSELLGLSALSVEAGFSSGVVIETRER
jgi:hypothetical protein